MRGRPPICDSAMSAAERKRRQRVLAKEARLPVYDQMINAIGKAAVDESRKHGMDDTLKKLSLQAARILEARGFDSRRSTEALQQLMGVGGSN